MEQIKTRNYTPYIWTALSVLAFISSTFIAGYMMHFNLNYSDEPYQILNSMDYKNSPLAPLTAIMDSITNRLFDYQILKLRYVAFCYTMLSIMLSGWYFAKKTGKINAAFAICSILTLLTIRNWNISFIGWDRQTMLFVTILVISTLEFFETGKKKYLVLCAVFAAIATLCRIPSVASLVFVPALILWKSGETIKQKTKDIALFLAISLTVIFGALLIMYGDLHNYITYLKANQISQHSTFEIIKTFASYFYLMLPLFLFYYSIYSLSKRISKNFLLLLFVIAATIF